MTIGKMKFRDFQWPHNPANCHMTYDKRIIKHTFPEIDGAEIEELGTEPRVISGSGVFFGDKSHYYWSQLGNLFYDGKPGVFYHPRWGSFYYMRLTKLTAKEEPLPNYVEYDFEFTEHKEINLMSKYNAPANTTTTVSNGKWVLSGGKWYYYINGVMVKNGWGQDSKGLWYWLGDDGAMVTNRWIQWKGYWYYMTGDGSMAYNGWYTISSKQYYFDASGKWLENGPPITTSTRTYTVLAGDTLTVIAYKFYGDTTQWRKIADANKNLITDPNILIPGWVLVIPY